MIDGLKPYPEYKDSGVSWVGEVPAHWESQKLRQVLIKKTERNRPELPLLSVVRDKGIILRDVSNREENRNYIPDDLSNYQVVRAGQFAINKMKAWQGSYGVSPFDGIVSPAYFVFDLFEIGGPFFHVAVRSNAYVPFFMQASDGVRIGQWDLSHTRMREIPIYIPSLPEQTAIVRFLNWAERRIRGVIQARKKRIKLMEEYKRTLIHRAITGQIDARTGQPYQAYKPSGVEWLGDVPKNWEVQRLRDSINCCVNGVWGQEPDEIHNVACIRVADFDYAGLTVGARNPTIRAVLPSQRNNRVLAVGDLLIEKSGGGDQQPVGRVVRFRGDGDAVCSNFIARMAPSDGFDGGYLVYLHAALYSIGLNERSIKQTTGIQNLDSRSYLGEAVAFPPLPEQTAIVEYLDQATAKLDSAIANDRRNVDLLNEFRTRLVADMITGKLDVREAVAELPEEAPDVEVEEPIEEGIVEAEETVGEDDVEAMGEVAL
jgi:type I restriction enzyme S subunit